MVIVVVVVAVVAVVRMMNLSPLESPDLSLTSLSTMWWQGGSQGINDEILSLLEVALAFL